MSASHAIERKRGFCAANADASSASISPAFWSRTKFSCPTKTTTSVLAEGELAIRKRRQRSTGLALTKPAEHFRLGRHAGLRQFFDGDVAEGNLRLAVAVDLQRDDAFAVDGRVALDPGDGALAVEKDLYLRPARDDFVAVPVAGPLESRDQIGVRHHEHLVAARLVVKAAGITRADVRLEAGHFIRGIRDAFAAKLHAAIHEAFRADEFVFEPQMKIRVALLRGEELIAWIPVERTADNHAIANAPDGIGFALPTGERFAVKQRDRRGRRCGTPKASTVKAAANVISSVSKQ